MGSFDSMTRVSEQLELTHIAIQNGGIAFVIVRFVRQQMVAIINVSRGSHDYSQHLLLCGCVDYGRVSRDSNLQSCRRQHDVTVADTVIPRLAVFSNTAHN